MPLQFFAIIVDLLKEGLILRSSRVALTLRRQEASVKTESQVGVAHTFISNREALLRQLSQNARAEESQLSTNSFLLGTTAKEDSKLGGRG